MISSVVSGNESTIIKENSRIYTRKSNIDNSLDGGFKNIIKSRDCEKCNNCTYNNYETSVITCILCKYKYNYSLYEQR